MGWGLTQTGAKCDFGWEHWVMQSQVTLGEPKDWSVFCGKPARITYQVPERTLGMRAGVSITCLLSLLTFLTPWRKMTAHRGTCSVLFSLLIFIWVPVLGMNSSHGCNNVRGAL